MLGVIQTQEALRRAREAGLDLVEVNPKTSPPVCKILDFGKYKYEEKKKKSEAKRKATVVEIKELKLRPKTDDHDLNVKLRRARAFLESGNKVKFTVRFRGREITHPERARMQLDWLVERLEDLAQIELRPTMEGRTMVMIASPRPQVLQRVQTEKALKAKREAAEKASAEEAAEEERHRETEPSSEDEPDSETEPSSEDEPDSEDEAQDSAG